MLSPCTTKSGYTNDRTKASGIGAGPRASFLLDVINHEGGARCYAVEDASVAMPSYGPHSQRNERR